jgi:hypothetical protein
VRSPGTHRAAAAFAALLVLTGCAQRGGATPAPAPPPSAELPADAALVMRVEYVGGFVPPEMLAGRLPVTSVYADGRVIVEGPVPAIYPGSAWPNVQVVDIGRDGVQELAERALAAGVAETGDLGTPPIADAPSTRFTLVTADATHVREVYGLAETAGGPADGLTPAQEAARRELSDLFAEVTGLGLTEAGDEPPLPYVPAAVAGVVRPWTAPEEDIAQGLSPAPVPWPGPALPGTPLGGLPDVTCVTATGAEATAVIEAAGGANLLTPWLSADGTRWSVLFRPLLPDESGCADLAD